jgi:hypothetical protein
MLERYRTDITPENCLLEAVGRLPQQLIQTSPFLSIGKSYFNAKVNL